MEIATLKKSHQRPPHAYEIFVLDFRDQIPALRSSPWSFRLDAAAEQLTVISCTGRNDRANVDRARCAHSGFRSHLDCRTAERHSLGHAGRIQNGIFHFQRIGSSVQTVESNDIDYVRMPKVSPMKFSSSTSVTNGMLVSTAQLSSSWTAAQVLHRDGG